MKYITLKACLVLLLITFVAGCLSPKDRRPGLRLRGEVAAEQISDWSFADAHPEVQLETKTWYGIPHSVTTVCAGSGANLYVPSIYYAGGEWPNKFWNDNVVSDPRVRIRIGGRIFEREIAVVEDPAEVQLAVEALAAKYPYWSGLTQKPANERPAFAIVRLDPRSQ